MAVSSTLYGMKNFVLAGLLLSTVVLFSASPTNAVGSGMHVTHQDRPNSTRIHRERKLKAGKKDKKGCEKIEHTQSIQRKEKLCKKEKYREACFACQDLESEPPTEAPVAPPNDEGSDGADESALIVVIGTNPNDISGNDAINDFVGFDPTDAPVATPGVPTDTPVVATPAPTTTWAPTTWAPCPSFDEITQGEECDNTKYYKCPFDEASKQSITRYSNLEDFDSFVIFECSQPGNEEEGTWLQPLYTATVDFDLSSQC